MSRTTLSLEAALLQNNQKTTECMRSTLKEWKSALECPLCLQLLQVPSTLTCSHSFCQACIDQYSCDHWECPVKGCGFPITVKGGSDVFRQGNPHLQTITTSWINICKALERAPDRWWDSKNMADAEEKSQPKEDGSLGEEEEVGEDCIVIDLQRDTPDSPGNDSRSASSESSPNSSTLQNNESFPQQL